MIPGLDVFSSTCQEGKLEICLLKLKGELAISINVKIEIEALGINENVLIYLLYFQIG